MKLYIATFTPPFKVGKGSKSNRVFDSQGELVVTFKKGLERMASDYVDFLNDNTENIQVVSEINELKNLKNPDGLTYGGAKPK